MAEVIDIRELNILIEQQSAFITSIKRGMEGVIVGQNTWWTACLLVC